MKPLRWPLWTLFFLAVLLRLLPVLATRSDRAVPDWPVPLDRDGLGYASYARHLWQGAGYIEDSGDRSHRAPGYPGLITLTFLLGGHQFLLLRMAQALIGAGACWLAFLIARAGWGEGAGRWAFLASAVYPPFVFYSPQVLNSTLYMALVLAVLASLVWASRGGPSRAGVPGVLLGLAALTAGTVLGAAPALAGWLAWRQRRAGWPAAAGAAAVMALGTLAVLAPWAARNYREHGCLILLDTNSGGVLYLGNVNHAMWVDPSAPDALDEVKRTTDYLALDEAGKDRLLRRLTLAWIRAHPGEFLGVWTAKFLHFWSPWPRGKGLALGAASLATYGTALALGLWGAWRAARERSAEGGLLVAYLLAVSAGHAVFLTAQRHRVPLMDPALIVLAASLAARPRAS